MNYTTYPDPEEALLVEDITLDMSTSFTCPACRSLNNKTFVYVDDLQKYIDEATCSECNRKLDLSELER